MIAPLLEQHSHATGKGMGVAMVKSRKDLEKSPYLPANGHSCHALK
jgi:hypothetical protein